MSAPPPSPLDGNQVLQHAFDDATGRIRVDSSLSLNASALEVIISHDSDSIRIGDGTDLVTTTTTASKVGLDVNIVGPTPISVTLEPNGIGGTPVIQNINMPSLSTEYSVALPAATKKIRLKARNNNRLQYTFTSGQSNSNFITVSPGNYEIINNIETTTALTLYFQSPGAEVLELLYWI